MPTYLIEIPHSENTAECKNIIRLFVESGSHLLSNAHWGCKDGVHKSWFIDDFDNKENVVQIIPPLLRQHAHIIELAKFNKGDIARFAEQKEEVVNRSPVSVVPENWAEAKLNQ